MAEDTTATPAALQVRLAELAQIAEGSKLLGAEGVFWRLCARYSPNQLAADAAGEAQRGTSFEQMMEGATVHIARQVAALARQTDQPAVVAQMLLEAIFTQVELELRPKPATRLPSLHYPQGGGHG